MAKQNITLNNLNINKGEVMTGTLFTAIQGNFVNIKTAIDKIPVFEVLNKVEPLKPTDDANVISGAINKLLADMKAKGYMKSV